MSGFNAEILRIFIVLFLFLAVKQITQFRRENKM